MATIKLDDNRIEIEVKRIIRKDKLLGRKFEIETELKEIESLLKHWEK